MGSVMITGPIANVSLYIILYLSTKCMHDSKQASPITASSHIPDMIKHFDFICLKPAYYAVIQLTILVTLL